MIAFRVGAPGRQQAWRARLRHHLFRKTAPPRPPGYHEIQDHSPHATAHTHLQTISGVNKARLRVYVRLHCR